MAKSDIPNLPKKFQLFFPCRVKCVSLTVVPDYVEQQHQSSPTSVSAITFIENCRQHQKAELFKHTCQQMCKKRANKHASKPANKQAYCQVSVTSLLTSLSLAHLAPRLLLNGFDTVPRLRNLATEDLNFLEVDSLGTDVSCIVLQNSYKYC